MLEPYLEFARKAFAREATYRMEVLTEIGSLVLRVYLLAFALDGALRAKRSRPVDLPLHAMITYATVALLMSLILEVDGTRLIREKIREGTIATDLMKPISLPMYFFSDGIGQTALHAVLVIPSLLCALLLVHIDVPPPATCAVFALSFAIGLRRELLFEFSHERDRLLDARNVRGSTHRSLGFRPAVGPDHSAYVLSGGSGTIVFALPFAAIYSTPLLIYVGIIPPSQWIVSFAVQAMWLLLFAALSAIVWRAASQKVVVQGG